MSAVMQRIRQRHREIAGQLDLLADETAEPRRECPACDADDVHRTRTGWECRTCSVSWRGPDDR